MPQGCATPRTPALGGWAAHRRRGAIAAIFALTLASAIPSTARGQYLTDRSSGVTPVQASLPEGAGAPSRAGVPDERALQRSPWWTPLASAALPGAGQAVLRQDRFVAYMAVEGYFWLRYFADRREARRQRDAYRDLATNVARAYFAGDKPLGDFEYYERMEHYIESGVFDVIPGGDLQPETDTATFNGSVWLLARRTYWINPDLPPERGSAAYERAEALYRERAITPEYRWSWRNAQLEQDIYRRTISRSNEAFRQSVQDLGVVLANHVLSTVDAYVAVRLERSPVDPGAFGASLSIPFGPGAHPARGRATGACGRGC